MYIEKIIRNQKRIERTIQLYEENQKKQNPEGSTQNGHQDDSSSAVEVNGGTLQIHMTIEPEPVYEMSEAEAVA
jgi:hypothetical protein